MGIGQGIEFDYCCVHGFALAEMGVKTIMYNLTQTVVQIMIHQMFYTLNQLILNMLEVLLKKSNQMV